MDKIIDYAPVGIITLNRIDHLKRCISSLSECTHAINTVLYIALDYPLKDEHWDGYTKALNYIAKIDGFKQVQIIKREVNYGAEKNFLNLNEIMFEKHDRLIITEDDNEFASNFLDYLNKGLTRFEDNRNIFAICAYNGLKDISKTYKANYYFNKNFVAWGYAMWRSSYVELKWDFKQLELFISNKRNLKMLKSLFPQLYYVVLTKIRDKGSLYGDGVITLMNIMNDTFSVFPTMSLVRNHGFDGSGVHNAKMENADKYHKQIIDDSYEFHFSADMAIRIEPQIQQGFKTKTKISLIDKIRYIARLNAFTYYLMKLLRKYYKK